jgi:hypothetical protein
MKWLVARQVNINRLTSQNRKTPLMIAAEKYS